MTYDELAGSVKLSEGFRDHVYIDTEGFRTIGWGHKVVHEDKFEDGKTYTKEELQDFVDGLTADQMRKLSAFYNSMPRLEHKMTVKNPKTEVESEVTLKGLASFFG